MKSTVFKRCAAVLLSALLVFSAAACSADPAEDGSDVNTVNVTLSILYPQDQLDKDKKLMDVESYPMQVEEDATVMQILESYSDQEGIQVEVDTSGTPYVTSINGVKADGSSSWVYEVGEDNNITKGAAEYKVKDGDAITWKYTAQ
ncbi:DUF4430 domain-containing protein [bacterium 210820-DFI.6.37]|nr:DUF4430 domain-containing protein [bacterium 210820-DFI.6.37]